MIQRAWWFRLLGLAILGLGLAVAVAGVAAYPYPANPYLSRKGTGSQTDADLYYAAISAPATFAQWYAQYFPNTTNTASAVYYNAGDLGFGREMHCREEFNFTACYVVNHGLGAAAPAGQAVQDAIAGARVLPTVAMVYDYTIEGQPNDVRFYIYDPAGNLVRQVALDSEGDKTVPHLCLPCHGGTYNTLTNAVSGASFLPFDVGSFGFSTQPGYTRADQAEALRRLNAFVHNSFPDPKIKTLIEGWYGGASGVYTPGRPFNDAYVPPAYAGSAADQTLYTQVVKPYCRSCHVAQAFDLETPIQLDSAFSAVYAANDMPHAEVTAHNFWAGPAPAILARSRGWAYRVTTLEDTPPPYSCHVAPCSLREAIIAANGNADLSLIVFDLDGTFRLTRAGEDDVANAGDLDIRADLILLGNGAARTILDGGQIDRVLHVQTGVHVVVQGVTVQNGLSSFGGGGVRNDGSLVTLNYSVLRDNRSSSIGFAGGGLAAFTGAITRISHSTIGPGNSGGGLGGGIFNDGSILEIRDSTISGNTGGTGGGLHNNFNAAATLIHTTITLNHATVRGGGLAVEDGAQTEVGRSVVAGNTSPGVTNCFVDSGAFQTSLGRNLVGQNGAAGGCPTVSSDQVLAGPLATALDPALRTDPVHGLLFHQPRPGSPVLDAIPLGPDCATPSYDARDLARPLDANRDNTLGCDIGAVEAVFFNLMLPALVR